MKITSPFRRRLFSVAIAALMLVAGQAFGRAQGLLTQKALSEQAALTITQGALDKCHADGTGPHTFEHARRKAYTALTVKRTSAETVKAWAASPTPMPVTEGTVGATVQAMISQDWSNIPLKESSLLGR